MLMNVTEYSLCVIVYMSTHTERTFKGGKLAVDILVSDVSSSISVQPFIILSLQSVKPVPDV